MGADTEEKGCLEKRSTTNMIDVGVERFISFGKKDKENMFDTFGVGDGLNSVFDRRLREEF